MTPCESLSAPVGAQQLTFHSNSIFNFALTLERLETAFYTQALDKFDLSALVEAGYSELQAAAILEQVQVIAFDELSHGEWAGERRREVKADPFTLAEQSRSSLERSRLPELLPSRGVAFPLTVL